MTQRICAIINPAAGGGRTGRQCADLLAQLRERGLDVEPRMTSAGGEAMRLARSALEEGASEIVVAGGDGTVNEVVNGFFRDGVNAFPEAVLSVAPCGTGGDFCRNLGISTTRQAVALVGSGPTARIDIGLLRYHDAGDPNGRIARCFVNSADVGYGARTARWVNRTSKSLGFLVYLVGAARTILVHPPSPAAVRVDGEQIFEGRAGIVVLANGRYHAGGMLFAPTASLCDGLLDVLILRAMPRWKLLATLLPWVYQGRHLDHPAVVHCRGRRISIEAPDPVPFEVDGESPGTTDIDVEVLPAALRVRRP